MISKKTVIHIWSITWTLTSSHKVYLSSFSLSNITCDKVIPVCQPVTGHMIEHVATSVIRSTSSRCDSPEYSHHLTMSLCTMSLYHIYTLCCAPTCRFASWEERYCPDTKGLTFLYGANFTQKGRVQQEMGQEYTIIIYIFPLFVFLISQIQNKTSLQGWGPKIKMGIWWTFGLNSWDFIKYTDRNF